MIKPSIRLLNRVSMRRVLLTTHKFFPQHRAGTEVLTLKVAQDLQKRGYEVLVVTANPPDLDARHPSQTLTSDYVHEGVPVHVVEESLRLSGYTFQHEYVHTAVGEHFKKIIADFAPDLVHIFHCQNLSASIIDVCVDLSVPVIFSSTDFWFVCPVVQLKRPDGALCRGPSPMATNCLTCYTPQLFPPVNQVQEALEKKYQSATKVISSLPNPLAHLTYSGARAAYIASKLPDAVTATVKRPEALRTRLNKVQKIMVPTKLMSDIFSENGINASLLQHVPFGLDIEPLLPFQKTVPEDISISGQRPLRIGFIGTIFEHKGVDILVRAFQQMPQNSPAELVIYGDMNQFPDYAKSIENIVDAVPEKKRHIKFPGTFPNKDFGNILKELDVLVVPSRWYENTPLVIQSALTTKTPVIATDLGGMSELIHHDENGLLFPLNDHIALSKQLMRLIAEPELLKSLMSNIKPERTINMMVDEIEAVYEKLNITRWSQIEQSREVGTPQFDTSVSNEINGHSSH